MFTLVSNVLATYLYSAPAYETSRLFVSTNAVSYLSQKFTKNIFNTKIKFNTNFIFSFCIGCPEAVFETVRREEIGDVVIINCDTNYVENPFNDVNEMPQDIVNYLKKHLNNSSTDLRGEIIVLCVVCHA